MFFINQIGEYFIGLLSGLGFLTRAARPTDLPAGHLWRGGTHLYFYDGTSDVDLTGISGGAAGGDLTGTYPNPTIAANAVDNTKLRDSTALSVIGRSANSTGDPADIAAAAASGAVLRESGSTLGFGTVATAGLATNAVDNTILRDSGALSVVGRSANSSGDPADIAATAASGAVLRESASVLGFGTIVAAGLASKAVTLAKMDDIATASVLGRNTALTGVPEVLATIPTGTVPAFTGDVTSPGGSLTLTIAALAVTDAKVATANKDGAAGTASMRTLGTGASQACGGTDARLSDARTPTAHAPTHKSGGTDAVKLDELAAPTDVTTLNVSISAHGLTPKLPNIATQYLDGTGSYSVPAGVGGSTATGDLALVLRLLQSYGFVLGA